MLACVDLDGWKFLPAFSASKRLNVVALFELSSLHNGVMAVMV